MPQQPSPPADPLIEIAARAYIIACGEDPDEIAVMLGPTWLDAWAEVIVPMLDAVRPYMTGQKEVADA